MIPLYDEHVRLSHGSRALIGDSLRAALFELLLKDLSLQGWSRRGWWRKMVRRPPSSGSCLTSLDCCTMVVRVTPPDIDGERFADVLGKLNVHTFMSQSEFKRRADQQQSLPWNFKPDNVQIRPGRCTFRRDTLGPSSWRKPIRAGGVISSQPTKAEPDCSMHLWCNISFLWPWQVSECFDLTDLLDAI